MADRERSRSPEPRDDAAAPASAGDDYPAGSGDNDTNGAANGGTTDDSVKLYVGNLDYGEFDRCEDS